MANELLPNEPAPKKTEETTGTENLVRQHMEDPNHIITDEDLMKIEIGKFDVDEVGEENLMPGKDAGLNNKATKEKDDDVDDSTPPNPWVVVK
ncbi:MAG TPA: hypothetical protein VM935_09425 [Chitinophagaceae bacterium]|nr:hypothetical protein [Chitinophagaceae bacterium]